MVKVRLVVVLQGLQLDVDGLIPVVLIAWTSIRPLVWQPNGITISQRQELWAAATAAAAGGLQKQRRAECIGLDM